MNKKNIKITFWVTFFLFSFIVFLLYLIYCFAYYDKYQEEVYLKEFNDNNYNFVYDNMTDTDGLSYEEFDKVIKLMYEKKSLKDIYYLYYRKNDYKTLDDFINTYFYGDRDTDIENMSYSSNGKTTLVNRRAIFYDDITVINKKGHKSSLGVKRGVSLNIESGATIKIDNKDIECVDTTCNIKKMFGGLHELSYISNGYEYYGIINVSKDKQVIDVTNIDSLVKVAELKPEVEDVPVIEEVTPTYSLSYGKYTMSGCFLADSDSCPSRKRTYLILNEDNTCNFYTYLTLDQAGDTYSGTYSIIGDFLVMKFSGHTYRVYDYDTKESTDITAEVDIEMRYKIEANNVISNDSYKFKFAE